MLLRPRARSGNPAGLSIEANVVIPDFIDGVLPDGIHTCTLEEVAGRFGRFQGSDRRPKLTNALKRYVAEVQALGVASALIIDGSYVTIKARPNDIDIILVLRENLDLDREAVPAEYNVRSMRMVKRKHGFDVRAVAPDSQEYTTSLEFFSRVRRDDPEVRTNRTRKGLLRIEL